MIKKHLLPLLFCIPVFSFADGFGNGGNLSENASVMHVFRDGSYTYFQYVNPVTGARGVGKMHAGSAWEPGTYTFDKNYKDSAHVRSGSTGVVVRTPVGVNVEAKIAKEKVYKNVFNNAKKFGKSLVGSAVGSLATWGKGGGPWGLAFNLLLTLGLNYVWDEEEQDFVREIPDASYLCAVPAVEGSHLLVSGEQCLKTPGHVVVPLPENYTSDTLQGFSKGLCERMLSKPDVKALIDKTFSGLSGYSLKGYDYGSSGCYFSGNPGGSWSYARILSGRGTIKEPLTYEEFVKYADPKAMASPDPWVQASADEYGLIDLGGQPKTSVKDGTSVVSDPYTNPNTGTAQQSRFDFKTDANGNTLVNEKIEERPDLTPNSPQAPKVTPEDVTVPGGSGDGGNNQTVKVPDLCKEHPEALACQQMGNLNNFSFDDVVIPKLVNNETWSIDAFLPSNGKCPEPKTFNVWGKEYPVSYQPLCLLAEKIRFIVLIGFILMSAHVVFGGLRKE